MICNKTIDCTSYTILIASIGLHNIALVLLFIFVIVGNHVHLLYHIAAEHCFWNLFYCFYAFGVLVCASYLCVVGADRAGASVGVGEGILLIMPWFHQLSDWSISTGKWKKKWPDCYLFQHVYYWGNRYLACFFGESTKSLRRTLWNRDSLSEKVQREVKDYPTSLEKPTIIKWMNRGGVN